MELASCHPSAALNFQVAARFLKMFVNFEVSGIAVFTRKGTRASVLCGYRNDSHRGSDGSSVRAHHTGLSWLDKRIFAYCAIDIIKS
jgi:hypothetical protein